MFGRNIYRDEAVLVHAQPEPLDALARVDVPHQYIATRALGLLCLIAVVWLALGSTERALWLQGTATPLPHLEGPVAALASDTARGAFVEISSYVTRSTAERLSVGMEVDVLLKPGATTTSVTGTLVSLERRSGQTPGELASGTGLQPEKPYRLVVVVPASEALQPGQDLHRLRVVLGQQRLFQFLASLVTLQMGE